MPNISWVYMGHEEAANACSGPSEGWAHTNLPVVPELGRLVHVQEDVCVLRVIASIDDGPEQAGQVLQASHVGRDVLGEAVVEDLSDALHRQVCWPPEVCAFRFGPQPAHDVSPASRSWKRVVARVHLAEFDIVEGFPSLVSRGLDMGHKFEQCIAVLGDERGRFLDDEAGRSS